MKPLDDLAHDYTRQYSLFKLSVTSVVNKEEDLLLIVVDRFSENDIYVCMTIQDFKANRIDRTFLLNGWEGTHLPVYFRLEEIDAVTLLYGSSGKG